MKKIKRIPSLAGGLNDVSRPDIIKDTETQICKNMEIKQAGKLNRRKAPEVYNADLSTAIDNLGVIENIFVWYPDKLPDDIADDTDEVYICYLLGDPSQDYELHVVYLANTGSYTNERIEITDINYLGSSDLKFVESPDKLIILDWDGNNDTHFISYDNDGVLVAGKLGTEASLMKPEVEQVTDWNSELWTEQSTEDYMSECGLIQIIYTCVTENGNESNPSPGSEWVDMQFFKLSMEAETLGETERWVNKIKIKNLSIPDTDDYTKERLKYFNVYFRYNKYSEGQSAGSYRFAQQFEIIDKENVNVSTENTYFIVLENIGDIASYENDIAPIAKRGLVINDLPMLFGIKQRIKFGFSLQYYVSIDLNNVDSATYVNGRYRIRIYGKQSNHDDSIENLDLTKFVDGTSFDDDALKHIRIFDSELQTMLPVFSPDVSHVGSPDYYIDIYIRVPQITGNSIQTIYLCWDDDFETWDGVDKRYFQDIKHGKFSDDKWDQHVFVQNIKRMNDYNILCSPMDEKDWENYNNIEQTVINKANMNRNGKMDECYWSELVLGNAIYCDNITMGDNCIYFGEFAHIAEVDYGELRTDKINYCTASGNISFSTDSLNDPNSEKYYLIFGDVANKYEGGEEYLRGWALVVRKVPNQNEAYFGLVTSDWNDNYQYVEFSYNMGEGEGPTTVNLFFSISVNFTYSNSKTKLVCIGNQTGTVYCDEELDIPNDVGDWDDVTTNWHVGMGAFPLFYVGVSPNHREFRGIPEMHYDRVSYTVGKYITSLDTIKNIANFMPAMDEIIGYKYSDAYPHNKHVTFGDVKSVEYKVYENRIKWGDVGGINFPDLNYKDLIGNVLNVAQSPFHRQTGQYTNAVYIWTRNRIYIFILSGDKDSWATSTNNLIQDKKSYGLYAEDTLAKDGSVFFWLSESGVCMMADNQIRLISDNENGDKRIDLGDLGNPEFYIGFINKTNNQYILHKQEMVTQSGYLLTEDGKRIETPDGYWVKY